MIEKHPCLAPALTGEVEALIDAVTTADGQSPLNEDAILSRTGGSTFVREIKETSIETKAAGSSICSGVT